MAGTLPAAIQLPTIYSGAIMATGENSKGAKAFLSTLAGAEGRAAVVKSRARADRPRALTLNLFHPQGRSW